MYYCKKIRALRREHGYTQAYLAEYLETTQQHYSCYENDKNEMPIRHLIKLCLLYRVSADEMLGLLDTTPDPS